MKKYIIIIIINAFCLIAFAASLFVSNYIKTPLRSQQAASVWAGQSGERFAQLSVFFPESVPFGDDERHGLYSSLNRALLNASLESTPEFNLYTDAWSAEGTVTLISERTVSPVTAPVFGVGGDFFLFHPLNLRDGSYLSPNDLMKDRVVLDEELAWRLFGSIRLAGFEVLINNRPFTIAGVVARENDFASSRAYTAGAGLFMSYEALSDLQRDQARIVCYEIVLVDPITGFAYNALSELFTGSNVHIIENSVRFSYTNLFDLIRSFGERSMRMESISYPYWENAALFVEDWLALLLVLTIAFIICPIVFSVIYLVKLILYFIRRGKKSVRKMIDDIDQRKYEKYLLEHDKEPQIYDVDDIIREIREEQELVIELELEPDVDVDEYISEQ